MLAALALLLCAPAATPQPSTVAIFCEPGFPVFAASRDVDPRTLAEMLRAEGVRTELLDAQQLADRRGLSARRHAALVCLYGNTFPQSAAANLARFHRAGGCLLGNGVPFCHECVPAGPVRWTRVAAADDRIGEVPRRGRNGSQALEIRHDQTSPWAGVTSRSVPAAPGDRFAVGGWLRGSTATDPADRLYVRFFAADGRFITQAGPALPADAAAWTWIEGEAVAPEGAARADVCLALFSRGQCLADDLVLRRSGEPTNLLANPGSEALSGAWVDQGHTSAFLGHDAIGAGGFRIVATTGRFALEASAGDPLRLRWLEWPELPPAPQAVLDPGSLPSEDEVLPVAGPIGEDGTLQGYSVAIIRHRCAQFAGATDVWLGYPGFGAPQGYQIALAAVAFVLQERGLLDERRADRLLPAAGRLRTHEQRRYALPARELPSDHILPKSPPPAERLTVTSLAQLGPELQLTLRALQGLANRQRPSVYIEDRWTSALEAEGYKIERLANPLDLLERFRGLYRGAAAYDPDVGASANLALMLCALEGHLPATAEVAAELGLEVKVDLRDRFRDDAEAYAWAREHLLPRCHPSVVAHIKQAEPLGVAAAEASASLADYLVAHRIFCFHLGREFLPADRLEAERILACYPAHTPVIGYFGPEPNAAPNLANEWEIVGITSALAKSFVFLVNDNLSVHSGLPVPTLQQRTRPLPELRDDKVYVAYYLSDGDSPSTWYRVWNHWDDPARGQLPLGWSLGPATLDVCPLPLRTFYAQATENDCFVNACSGAGYIYPEQYGAQVATDRDLLMEFADRSATAMQRCDLGVLNVHHYPTISDATLDRVADRIPNLTGLIAGYGKCAESYAASQRLSPAGVPIFRCLTTGMGLGMSHDEIVDLMHQELVAAIAEERPAFVQAFAIYWFVGPADVQAVAQRMGPDIVFVRPDELPALYREWRSRQ